ncbi:MAG: DNA-3-methyladenine glycosylase I [Pseudomonadota bacterium]
MNRSITADDGRARCNWVGNDDLYAAYHDREWGVPQTDSIALFEKVSLEGFQAGLSWITILRKRENFRSAFDGFQPKKIARYTDKDIARLMGDAGIVRNRAKIEAAISNAQAYLALEKRIPFADFVWGFIETDATANHFETMGDVPAQTDISKAMSKALKKEGFRFVGPTTMYAFMQSVGMVNDHLTGCHRHAPCEKLQATHTRKRRAALSK